MNNHHLQDLTNRTLELISACRALDSFFVHGAARLRQEADARRLETFAVNFARHLDEEEWHENTARLRSDDAEILRKGSELAVAAIGLTFMGRNGMKAVNRNMKAKHAGQKRYHGMIVVGVGAGGLPDDVTIVPVSRLARTQNREESDVIRELQQQSGLLFTPEAFLLMLGTLIKKLSEGKLQLPISLEQLPTKLAIPRKVTVGFPISVKPTVTGPFQVIVGPQLPPGKDTDTQI